MSDALVQRIYVAVLGEGPDAWCPVDAVFRGENTYEIVSGPTDVLRRAEYVVGDVVRCRSTVRPNHERILVATRRVSPSEDG